MTQTAVYSNNTDIGVEDLRMNGQTGLLLYCLCFQNIIVLVLYMFMVPSLLVNVSRKIT